MTTESKAWVPAVGDRVRVKEVPSADWAVPVGFEYEITEVRREMTYGHLSAFGRHNGLIIYNYLACLEPAEPAPVSPAPECAACGGEVHDHEYLFAVAWNHSDRVELCEPCWQYSRDEEMTERIQARRAAKLPTPQPKLCRCGQLAVGYGQGPNPSPEPLCGSCEVPAVAAGLKEDPYHAHRVALEQHGITEANLHEHPKAPEKQAAREAARLRNIAALKSELSQSSAERRARLHEGRSERALPYSNGRK